MRDTDTPVNGTTGTNTRPADDLADVWDVLDTLPQAMPAADLSATTVELVAARAANDVGGRVAPLPRSTDRIIPLAIVIGSLVIGILAGRMTAPDPDQRVLERLPVIEHLSLLQEAGSVEFLEALAAKMKAGEGNGPRWLRLLRDPSELREEAQEFDAAARSLRDELRSDGSSRDRITARREKVEELSAGDLLALEKSAATFESLPTVDRRDLERVATALADPAQASLRDAAKLWHIIVTAINPAFRRNIIDMSSDERIEWLTRTAGRFDPRMPSRSRDDDRGGDRRPPEVRGDGGEKRGWNGRPPGSFQRPPTGGPGSPNGRPGPGKGMSPTFQDPSITGPATPRPAGPGEVPSETRAAPR